MKMKLKQMFRELVEYIEFPTIVYIYETNRIIAINDKAIEIMGDHSNVKDIIEEKNDRKYSKELLDNGSQIIYNRKIIVKRKTILIDIEVNSFLLDDVHVIICLFDHSDKGIFLEPLSNNIPRIFWKDRLGNINGGNAVFVDDFELSDIKNKKYRSENYLADDEICDQIKENETCILSGKSSLYDVIQTINTIHGSTFFIRIHRIPLINKNETSKGFLGVYSIILNRDEEKQGKEIEIINDKVFDSDDVFLSYWLEKGQVVKNISSQITKYGYNQEYFMEPEVKWSSIIIEEDYKHVCSEINNINCSDGQQPIFEYRIITGDRKVLWVREKVLDIKEFNEKKYIESVLYNINTEKIMELELLDSKKLQKESFANEKRISGKIPVYFQKLDIVLNKMNSSVYVIEKESRRILYVNEKVTEMYGDDIIGRSYEAFLFEKEISPFLLSNNENEEYAITEFYDRVNRKYYSIRYEEILWMNKTPAIILNLFDVTNLIISKKSTEIQTNNDILTGLYNRNKFIIDFEMLYKKGLNKGKEGYIVYMDLDDFKQFNEKQGRECGDGLLKAISRYIMNLPLVKGKCYRMGGDEFMLILHNVVEKEMLELIEMLNERYKLPWHFNNNEYYCTISMGVVRYCKCVNKAGSILKKAAVALNEARHKGKCQFYYLSDNEMDAYKEPENIERYLKKAVNTGCVEFAVYYQPIVDSISKEIIGAEALLRWKSEELGILNPSEFIPLTEYMGLILPLGEFVLKEAFETCKKYKKIFRDNFKMHINLSVVQLVQSDIYERIMEIIRLVDVNPDNIVFEVTESLAIDDILLMEQMITKFRNTGFGIALDDFGTGYSALNHLMKLPLDYIKIDRSIISNYGTEKFNPSLLNAIIELAHGMNIKIIIEGVEIKKQVEFLTFLSTDAYQGYYYGKPVCENEFENIMKSSLM